MTQAYLFLNTILSIHKIEWLVRTERQVSSPDWREKLYGERGRVGEKVQRVSAPFTVSQMEIGSHLDL